ncbi:hypothetical protein GCM10027413_32050 [Conyzicola nivalis]|uniref:Uncharacterized protein n=1 Tax=Conyzicola nivalis TaxID=1477021 RepID=A0A916WLJ1_9MICO|nr:hypothetical protein [Conyzicola nivalis]GGB11661.1 hypothetical protein GCM10010979_27480 [Conyzicola nivalis]
MAKGLVIGGAAFVVVIVVIIVVAVVLVSNATSARPSPQPFVERYLTAVSEGDAQAARAIDDRTLPEDGAADPETFRSDAVLQAATERISDVQIDDVQVFDRDSGRVTASYTLAGGRENLIVNVEWDESSDGWALRDGVFHAVEVAGGTSSVDDSIPFFLAGVPSTDPVAITPGRAAYLAYPGVYPFELALSQGVLSDPAAVPSQLQVTPGPDEDPDVVYVQLNREPTVADLITTPENG